MHNKTGFIGLGTMGLPMANCLRAAGIELTAWDADASARSRFEGCGDALESLAADCEVFITMLPEGSHVEEVINQLLRSGVKHNSLFIDCSTIDVDTTRRLAASLSAHSHGFVDAPVSGGNEAAAGGNLSFMVGGDHEAVAKARPLLEIMGSRIIEFGPAGGGQAAKACHNMICGVTALGVCESFALADALGLDLDRFFQLCSGAAAQSWILENRCPVPGPAPGAPACNEYAPGFAARLMAKDLGLAQQAAASCGQATEFGAAAARRFRDFADGGDGGDGELDFSAIYRTIRR